MNGLQHCHSRSIIHRDIKLDNILLSETGIIKIGDFGVSKEISKGEFIKNRCGTPIYIAPEILREIPYDGIKADIWSAGIVLYAMLYGTFPFKGDCINALEESILTGYFNLDEKISRKARTLLKRILTYDPNLRPSIREILEDPWMEECDDTSNF